MKGQPNAQQLAQQQQQVMQATQALQQSQQATMNAQQAVQPRQPAEPGGGEGHPALPGEGPQGPAEVGAGCLVRAGSCVTQDQRFGDLSVIEGMPAHAAANLEAPVQRPDWALRPDALDTICRLS